MKKFLEVLMDDDGLLHVSTDFEFPDSVVSPPGELAKRAGEMEDLSIFRTDLKQVLRAVQVENDRDALRKLLTEDPSFRSVDHDAAVTLQTLTEMNLRIPPGR